MDEQTITPTEDRGNEMPIPCEQEQNITEIKGMIHGLTKEFRAMLGEMRSVFVEDREHKIKIETLEKGQEIIFNKLREINVERAACVREKIDPVVEWKNRIDGSLSALKVIPIVCVIITTLMALYTFTVSQTPVETKEHSHTTYDKSKVGVP